jgi:hypothetical protein
MSNEKPKKLLQVLPVPENLRARINTKGIVTHHNLIALALIEDYLDNEPFKYIDGSIEGEEPDLAGEMSGYELLEFCKPRKKLPKRHESLKRKPR